MAGGVYAAVVDGTTASQAVAVMTGLLALLVVLASRWGERLDAAVHEGGHALAAYLTGRQVLAVWVDADGGGATLTRGRSRGAAIFMTVAAGYTGPPLVGVCSAALLARGRVTAVLILAVLGLAALLLVTVNRFGQGLIVGTIASLVIAGRYSPDWVQLWYFCFLAWVLLLSGPRSVLTLHRARRDGAGDSDADLLATLTRIPGPLWVLGFAAFSLWCALRGAVLLLGA
ncbi:Integral membrane protein [Frankia sp. AiPs1]|uniref:M50 family metallopeptidase n=1 Tax=Frankia sp. AiPa1 TaxID=573492 RepID=UPI00202B84C2|nr:M50 family metallopeptidase [Frankia sp. AiPa1]MCL9760940.1 M50 family metallopeptidase [Frankia sp. AiPa1]